VGDDNKVKIYVDYILEYEYEQYDEIVLKCICYDNTLLIIYETGLVRLVNINDYEIINEK